jgi:signal transduction histidine kinase
VGQVRDIQDGIDRVLVVYQDNPTLPAVIEIAEALNGRLKEELGRPEIYPEYLDATRFAGPEHLVRVAEALTKKYAESPPDVVVAIGPEALRFMLEKGDGIAPGNPLVFGDLSQRSFDRLSPPPDVSGVITPYDVAKTIELAMRLQPEAKGILVMSGSGDFDRYWQQSAQIVLGDRFRSLPVEYLSGLTLEQFVARASALRRASILLFLTLLEDAAGRKLRPKDAVTEIAGHSAAPVYGLLGSYVGTGIVGGHMATYRSTGEDVASLVASTVREGKSGLVLAADGRPVVDWRQVRRWGMNVDDVPEDTELLFYSPTLWEQYHWLILSIALALAAQTLAILGLLYQRRRRRLAEHESRRRLLEVVHLNQSATAGALSASMAHELNQPIGAIRSNADAADAILRGTEPDLNLVRDILADIRDDDQRAGEIVLRLRAMLKKRDSIELQRFDVNEVFDDALRVLHGEAARRSIRLSASRADEQLPVRADRLHVQQVILNLVTNAMDALSAMSAHEKRVELDARLLSASDVVVTVTDSGEGIPKEKLPSVFEPFFTTKADGMGLGLSIARAIVEIYGGKIWADNLPGGGATFRFTLPVARN